MTSAYRINYQLRAHKRDEFIEFIKGLLLTPFVLHMRPRSTSALKAHACDLNLASPARLIKTTLSEAMVGEVDDAAGNEMNVAKYSEIMSCIEDMVLDHMLHCNSGVPELSRLSQLVPTVGRFFTPLPLKNSFLYNNRKRSIAGRRNVPPSFNDVRNILNTAQVMAIAPTLKLITFDGDMTLYADGADFERDSQLVAHLLELLDAGLYVSIVTAAGYPNNPARYEQRLSGLLHGLQDSVLEHAAKARFFVLGGECNYLFRYDPHTHHLASIPEDAYHGKAEIGNYTWPIAPQRIKELLDVAEAALRECIDWMGVRDKVTFVRKARACGVVASPGCHLTREQLDELVLSVQGQLTTYQSYKRAVAGRNAAAAAAVPDDEPAIGDEILPFCAFNGGSDVWVDVGNKLVGVHLLQQHLGAGGHETLHIGDQFLSTGNDLSTRNACCTSWITSPQETAELLQQLNPLLAARQAATINGDVSLDSL
ncbi:hypothetical protein SeMB42_g02723 [Synchytrium endobioticum]|uniref:IMP-specific 5'-nucleotidase 1 n=1 Tax=Synchytrium endobioticum TaxID=286115 RepID=A0A507DE19_9FUNG|nr:hypothetical protein SeLEV6574_g07862 [Synchytrium endobioticum]TPX49118.1 hypothetical protein SeMB42_g02723 [Synchytrium endobioticum]